MGSAVLFIIAVIQGNVANWWERLGCPYWRGGPAIPFLGLLWHLSPSTQHCCWKQKLLSNFQTQSGALWAGTGKTGSTSLAAVALAPCLPWIGTSRDCRSLGAGWSWRPQRRSWNPCACICCVWQRIRCCCNPRFCYPRYVCSSYLFVCVGKVDVLFVAGVLEGGNLYKFLVISKDSVYLSIFCYLFDHTAVNLSHLGAVN